MICKKIKVIKQVLNKAKHQSCRPFGVEDDFCAPQDCYEFCNSNIRYFCKAVAKLDNFVKSVNNILNNFKGA